MAKEHLIGKGFESRPDDINRNGRPVGSKNRSTIMRKVLDMQGTLPDEMFEALKEIFPGIEKKMTFEEMASIAQAANAVKGDTAAYKAMMDSAYGAPKQDLEISSEVSVSTKITFK
jgi:hypothetical protein